MDMDMSMDMDMDMDMDMNMSIRHGLTYIPSTYLTTRGGRC